MRLKFTEYWEKVDRTGCEQGEWGKVLRGEYNVKGVYRHEWPSLREFMLERCMERVNGRRKWKPRWSRIGRILYEDQGKSYGIHMYTTVEEVRV